MVSGNANLQSGAAQNPSGLISLVPGLMLEWVVIPGATITG